MPVFAKTNPRHQPPQKDGCPHPCCSGSPGEALPCSLTACSGQKQHFGVCWGSTRRLKRHREATGILPTPRFSFQNTNQTERCETPRLVRGTCSRLCLLSGCSSLPHQLQPSCRWWNPTAPSLPALQDQGSNIHVFFMLLAIQEQHSKIHGSFTAGPTRRPQQIHVLLCWPRRFSAEDRQRPTLPTAFTCGAQKQRLEVRTAAFTPTER